MAQLDDLKVNALVRGLLPGNDLVTIISVIPHASIGAEVVYRDAAGQLASELVYEDRLATLEVLPKDLSWSFDADGALFRLVSEAYRIRLAYLFDPLIAVHTSQVEPLPHQITAVYETMLARQPLRYLLADDPGAGKTIMAGLLIKELMIRSDLHRCLIISPGNLTEQWQDELHQRFQITFEILTNDRIEASASGNPFTEMPLCIARLDKLSRNERLREKLQQTEWDLVVVDEAHKMSATFFSGEAKFTKRYQLGQLLGSLTRDRVGRALDLLNDGLKPFVVREMEAMYGPRWQYEAVSSLRDHHVMDDGQELRLDIYVLLNIMSNQWHQVFKKTLGQAERNYVSELRDVRNKWAHQEPFSTQIAYRAMDSAQLLLMAVSAPAQAEEVERQKTELLRTSFDSQARSVTRRTTGALTEGATPKGLLSWRHVITPHPDVASGRYQVAEFAADLAQVYRSDLYRQLRLDDYDQPDEYRDPYAFFRRTFLTGGLR